MYEQIRAQLSDAIIGGDIAEGEMLPSLRQLAAQLRVSIITVTRAYNELVAMGLASNEHGRGFVVCAVAADHAAAVMADRVTNAISEVVSAGRTARLDMTTVLGKVEAEWMRRG
ncbi:GntR family transcriptional regulator [Microbacterium protaetiae]|uniref:GntR family transcriptional regulator n=1 Tax=Microbacterium protaetiae TaxID=2509458 RepID=A0A4P6EJ62_9MICO|nr:winged helix-turn-helix domain-containing protein [Microbacterium protaetiae]QAY61663.1 GntR family transcriptional regulator [Microbacterium protaetiae]